MEPDEGSFKWGVTTSLSYSKIIISSYDFEFINTIANRVIDLNQPGSLSKELPYEEYLKEIVCYKIK